MYGSLHSLFNLQQRLRPLEEKLGEDAADIKQLKDKLVTSIGPLTVFLKEGVDTIVEQNAVINLSDNPDIKKSYEGLKDARRKFTMFKDQFDEANKEVQTAISRHRENITKKHREVSSFKEDIKDKEHDIDLLAESIQLLRNEMDLLEKAERELIELAKAKEEQKSKELRKGIIGIAGSFITGAVAIATAPFTAGGSLALLALAGGGGVYTGMVLDTAADCQREADGLRNDASQKRSEMYRIERNRDSKRKEKDRCEEDIQRLTSEINECERKIANLVEFNDIAVNDALEATKVIDAGFRQVIQETEIATSQTDQQLSDELKRSWSDLKTMVWANMTNG